jgi:hypothetical protein
MIHRIFQLSRMRRRQRMVKWEQNAVDMLSVVGSWNWERYNIFPSGPNLFLIAISRPRKSPSIQGSLSLKQYKPAECDGARNNPVQGASRAIAQVYMSKLGAHLWAIDRRDGTIPKRWFNSLQWVMLVISYHVIVQSSTHLWGSVTCCVHRTCKHLRYDIDCLSMSRGFKLEKR